LIVVVKLTFAFCFLRIRNLRLISLTAVGSFASLLNIKTCITYGYHFDPKHVHTPAECIATKWATKTFKNKVTFACRVFFALRFFTAALDFACKRMEVTEDDVTKRRRCKPTNIPVQSADRL